MGKNRFKLEDLIVNSNQLVRIRTSDPLFKKNIIQLRPKSIHELKEFIGMDKSIEYDLRHGFVTYDTSAGFLSLFDKKELQGQNINELGHIYSITLPDMCKYTTC